ncbi:MAG: hypothetical protein IJ153_10610 [Clostridia bacterium]|nr:hypothetical protein [Clostridia bacterium]
MNNAVIKKAADTVEAFRKDYAERIAAAEKQMEQLEDKQAKAEAAAEKAAAANDQAAWRKADKERMEIASSIKFTLERLAMIQREEALPLRDYNTLRDQISAEQSRATLEFVEELQDLYRQAIAAYDKLRGVLDEGREALGLLYAAGGEKGDGYIPLEGPRANWGFLMGNGEIFNKDLLAFDIKTGAGLNPNDPVHRAVMGAKEVLRRKEGKE